MGSGSRNKTSAAGVAWLVLVGFVAAVSQGLPLVDSLWTQGVPDQPRVIQTGDEPSDDAPPAKGAWERAVSWMGSESDAG